jgi:hypothetical protein
MSKALTFHEQYKPKLISCKQQKHTPKKQQNIKKWKAAPLTPKYQLSLPLALFANHQIKAKSHKSIF